MFGVDRYQLLLKSMKSRDIFQIIHGIRIDAPILNKALNFLLFALLSSFGLFRFFLVLAHMLLRFLALFDGWDIEGG